MFEPARTREILDNIKNWNLPKNAGNVRSSQRKVCRLFPLWKRRKENAHKKRYAASIVTRGISRERSSACWRRRWFGTGNRWFPWRRRSKEFRTEMQSLFGCSKEEAHGCQRGRNSCDRRIDPHFDFYGRECIFPPMLSPLLLYPFCPICTAQPRKSI